VNSRRLVVNADDFGLSAGVNDGVAVAHERGIVTTASLMVRMPAAADAASYARATPTLGVGLHVDLGEWAFQEGAWTPVYERVDETDARAVGREVRRQLSRFCELMGRAPTHLDSHQHVHRREPARAVLSAAAAELGVPLRHETRGMQYCGAFYGQTETGERYPEGISPEHLVALLTGLGPGTTELCCHPAATVDFDAIYAEERPLELDALVDPVVRASIELFGIELVDFEGRPR
jgi:predicted glycoside hydrolase/deacetylase ChbG (UPF0249 family)